MSRKLKQTSSPDRGAGNSRRQPQALWYVWLREIPQAARLQGAHRELRFPVHEWCQGFSPPGRPAHCRPGRMSGRSARCTPAACVARTSTQPLWEGAWERSRLPTCSDNLNRKKAPSKDCVTTAPAQVSKGTEGEALEVSGLTATVLAVGGLPGTAGPWVLAERQGWAPRSQHVHRLAVRLQQQLPTRPMSLPA